MYLMRGMAALAMGLVVVSCNKLDFSNQAQISEEEALQNAEMQLGVTIDPNQDWKMTKDVQATVSVNLGTGKEYTLLMFNKNPFVNDDAVYYFKQSITDGSEGTYTITVPSAQKQLYVIVIDDKDYSVSKYVFFDENAFSVNLNATANARAMRRANTGETYAQTSDGINANANEWADTPDAPHGHGGWLVPSPLTNEQKEVVRKYFQAVPNPTYEDPHLRHFFVQQVYKGGTSVPTTGNKEDNVAADGTTHYSSANMNLLTVGYNEQHINNFNNGTYSGSGMNTYEGAVNQDGTVNVLDSAHTVNEFADNHHADQIMLMVNINDTECMGYHNTGSSQQKNDKAGLVDWKTIRTWANTNLGAGTGDCLNDGWNRSFVGFDFELLSLEDSYAKDNSGTQLYAPISAVPGNAPQYVWTGTEVQKRQAQSASRRVKGKRAKRVAVGDVVPMNETVNWAVPENFNPTDGQTVDITNAAGTVILGTLTFHGTGGAASAQSSGNFNYFIERPSVSFKANYSLNQACFKINGPWAPFYCTDNDGYFSLYGTTYNGGYKNGEMNLSGNVQAGHTYTVRWDGSNVQFWGFTIYHQGNLTVTSETMGDGTSSSDNTGNNNNNNNNDNSGNNTQSQSDSELNVYTGGDYIVVNGENVPYLDANMNQYGGIQKSLADGDMKITKDGRECLNLPKFKELIDDGYLPVEDKNLRTWVKWQGGDGYYSDWIVTLTEAKRQSDTETHMEEIDPHSNIYSYAFEDTKNGDYDMNDVVLKCQENEDGENIDVWLVAAGATLDLEINLYEYDETNVNGEHPYYGNFVRTLEYNGKTEIHDMWEIDRGTMVNTNAGANKAPIRIAQLPKSEGYEADKLRFTIKSVVWEVFLSGSGQAPYGVVIPFDWKWPTERTRITNAYNETNTTEAETDQSFAKFASQAGAAEKWYEYPTTKVMIKNFK